VVDLGSAGGFPTASGSSRPGGTFSPAVIVVRGLAGSGKTALLRALAAAGEQVLDLEGLARHRGSAFGHLGGGAAQPSHREFQRQVRAARTAADPARPLWVEDEGPFIGSVGVPPELQEEILTGPAVELRSPWEQRVGRLLADYGGSPPDALCAAIRRTRRLEPAVAARAIAAVRAGRTGVAIELVLPAFDSAYRHRMTRAPGPLLAVLACDGQRSAAAVREAVHLLRPADRDRDPAGPVPRRGIVGHIDDREAAEVLLALDERPVGEQG